MQICRTTASSSTIALLLILAAFPHIGCPDPPNITSVVPNHPAVVLTSLFTFSYSVPIGFNEIVLTCNAVGRPLPPKVRWLRGNITKSTLSDSRNTTVQDSSFTLAKLQFRDGFSAADAGRYLCVVVEELDQGLRRSVEIVLSTNFNDHPGGFVTPSQCGETTAAVYFQIRVFGLTGLGEANLEGQVTRDFFAAVIGGIVSQCHDCLMNAGSSAVIAYPPTDSEIIAGAAIFRGVINSTKGGQTEAVLCALNTWKQSGPLAHINGSLLLIDRDCAINPSNNSIECPRAAPESLFSIAAGSSGILILFLVLSISTIGVALLSIHKCYTKRMAALLAKNQDQVVREDTQHVSVYRGSMYEFNDDPVVNSKESAYLYDYYQGNTMEFEDAITESDAYTSVMQPQESNLY